MTFVLAVFEQALKLRLGSKTIINKSVKFWLGVICENSKIKDHLINGCEMNNKLKEISEMVAQANDQFHDRNAKIDVVMGLIDKGLRQQGIKADAISVDCIPLDKKIVFLLHDDKPNSIGIALGNKQGDIHSSSQQELSDLSVSFFLMLMEENFVC